MRLNETRDYTKIIEQDMNEYEKIKDNEAIYDDVIKLSTNNYNLYPESVRHYLSLFPNNHIDLFDCQKNMNMKEINDSFRKLIHDDECTERAILSFINHERNAFYIIGAIFKYFYFGHHEAFIFPEFSLGGKYFADYLLIGKSSGGYEFIFVELEKSQGRITLKNGYFGESIRKGNFQIDDWEAWIESNFGLFSEELKKYSNRINNFPKEFLEYDSTRFHYVTVAGLRSDYTEKTYWKRRKENKKNRLNLHYDNLVDKANELIDSKTF